MEDGIYETENGSRVQIRNGKPCNIHFDWFEEPHACFDCQFDDVIDKQMVWSCDECEGGCAELIRIKKEKPNDQ